MCAGILAPRDQDRWERPTVDQPRALQWVTPATCERRSIRAFRNLRFAKHVHNDRHSAQPADRHQLPPSGLSLPVGELIGQRQTNAHAQRHASASDQDQLWNCHSSFLHEYAPVSSDAIAAEAFQRHFSIVSPVPTPLTPMLSPMMCESDPRFLHRNAMLLTDLISAIKLRAEQVFERGHSKSKAIDAGAVFLGQPFTFTADQCFCSSHAHTSCTSGSHRSR